MIETLVKDKSEGINMSNISEEFGIPVVHAELVRDRILPFRKLVTQEDIVNILHELLDRSPTEQIVVLHLHDTILVSVERVAIGQSGKVLVGMSEIFRGAILAGATHIVVAHNHLNNDTTPSDADLNMTDVTIRASLLMGIGFIDHIITSPDGTHYSMFEHSEELEYRLREMYKKDLINELAWEMKKYRMLPGLDLNKIPEKPLGKKSEYDLDFTFKKPLNNIPFEKITETFNKKPI